MKKKKIEGQCRPGHNAAILQREFNIINCVGVTRYQNDALIAFFIVTK